ncbi:hypothetical protein BIS06_18860 [Halomonas sp. BBD48]|nr:hypothetical protein [Halomonas sp. BBD48]
MCADGTTQESGYEYRTEHAGSWDHVQEDADEKDASDYWRKTHRKPDFRQVLCEKVRQENIYACVSEQAEYHKGPEQTAGPDGDNRLFGLRRVHLLFLEIIEVSSAVSAMPGDSGIGHLSGSRLFMQAMRMSIFPSFGWASVTEFGGEDPAHSSLCFICNFVSSLL